MTKTKIIAAIGASTLALMAGSASAQQWQGGYIGIAGGFALPDDDESERVVFDTNLDGNYNDTVRTSAGADAFGPGAIPGGFCGGTPNSENFNSGCEADDEGQGEVSFRAGYDWASGPIVFGVVGELSKSEASDTVTAFSITPAQYSFERKLDYLWALRGRIGYQVGGFLPYVTAGGAYGRMDNTFNTSNVANSFSPRGNGTENTGYQAGGGVETYVGENLRLGVEYIYTSLEDDSDLTTRVGPGTAPATNPFLIVNAAGTNLRRAGSDFNTHAVRLSVSFAF